MDYAVRALILALTLISLVSISTVSWTLNYSTNVQTNDLPEGIVEMYMDVFNDNELVVNGEEGDYYKPDAFPATFYFYNDFFFIPQDMALTALEGAGYAILGKQTVNSTGDDSLIGPVYIYDTRMFDKYSITSSFKYSRIVVVFAPEYLGSFTANGEEYITSYFVIKRENGVFKGFTAYDLPYLYYPPYGQITDLVVFVSPMSATTNDEWYGVMNYPEGIFGEWISACELALDNGAGACIGFRALPDTYFITTIDNEEVEIPSVFSIPFKNWILQFFAELSQGSSLMQAKDSALSQSLLAEINQGIYDIYIQYYDPLQDIFEGITALTAVVEALGDIDSIVGSSIGSYLIAHYIIEDEVNNYISFLEPLSVSVLKALKILFTNPYIGRDINYIPLDIRIYGNTGFKLIDPPPEDTNDSGNSGDNWGGGGGGAEPPQMTSYKKF